MANVNNLNNAGMTGELSLATYIALVSIALNKPTLDSMVVLGEFSIGGTINRVDNLADRMQMALDSGSKNLLLPNSAMMELASVPPEVATAFTLNFYSGVEDAVFKALGVPK